MNTLYCEYDAKTDTLTIEGQKYAGSLFRAFRVGGMRKGQLFMLLDRKDGTTTVRMIDRLEEYNPGILRRAWKYLFS